MREKVEVYNFRRESKFVVELTVEDVLRKGLVKSVFIRGEMSSKYIVEIYYKYSSNIWCMRVYGIITYLWIIKGDTTFVH